MNSCKISLFAVRIAGALALCSLLISSTMASSNAAGRGDPFVATTANCRTEDTHAWAYPTGYLRGQDVMCDLLSGEPRVKGCIRLQQACPVNGMSECDATFRIDADTGARWEGQYWTEAFDTQLVLRGAGLGDLAGAQIVFAINNLTSASGWRSDSKGDDVVGRIIAAD